MKRWEAINLLRQADGPRGAIFGLLKFDGSDDERDDDDRIQG